MALCLGKDYGYDWCVDNFCRVMPNAPECTKGNPCRIKNPDVADCQHCCAIKYYSVVRFSTRPERWEQLAVGFNLRNAIRIAI